MENTAAKGTRETKFLYTGIVVLLIIAVVLVLVLISPFSPLKPAPSQPTYNQEEMNALLSAPSSSKPAEIPEETLRSLEGKSEPTAPSQEMIDMLSAPQQ